MKSTRPGVRITMTHHRILPSALAMGLFMLCVLPSGGINVPPGITGSRPDCGCDDTQSSASTGSSSENRASLDWALKVGLVKYRKENDLLASSREGAAEGSMMGKPPRSLDQIMAANHSSSPMNRAQMELRFSVDAITAALADPAIFSYNHDAGGEVIELNGFINQVLTDDALTHIDKPASPAVGFRIRVWHRSTFTLNTTKSNNLYPLPASSVTPIAEYTFRNPDGATDNGRLEITRVENIGSASHTTITRYTQTGSPDKMTVETYASAGSAETLLSREILTYSNRGAKKWDYDILREIYEAPGAADGALGTPVLIARDYEKYADFSIITSTTQSGGEPGARRLIQHTTAYGTAEAATTTCVYIKYPGNALLNGRLQSISRPDGSWEYHTCTDSVGAASASETTCYPWKNGTMANRESNARKVETLVEPATVTRTTTVGAQQVAKEKWTTSTSGDDVLFTVQRWDGGDWLTTTTCRYPDNYSDPSLAGRPKWIEHEDGTATTHAYASGGTQITTRTGAGSRSGVTAGTETVRVHTAGNIVTQETVKDIASTKTISSWVGSAAVGRTGRPVTIYYNGDINDYATTVYGCCGIESERDRTGAVTTYFRDALKRVWRASRQASSTAVATTTAHNGLTTTVKQNDGTTTLLVSETTRSLGGRTITSKSPDANGDANPETTTSITTYNSGGGTTTTVTYPDTTATSSVTFADGRTASATDQENHTTTCDYGTHNENGGGLWSKTISPITTEWVKTCTDPLGRSFKTEYPDGAIATSTYHPHDAANGSKGKLASSADPDENAVAGTGSSVSYSYNPKGERDTTSEAVADSQTRTTVTVSDVIATVTIHGVTIAPAIRTTTTVNDVLVSTSYRSTDGNISASDSHGRQTVTEQTVPADGAWTVTSVGADNVQTRQFFADGQLRTSVTFQAGSTLPTTAPSNITTYAATGFIGGSSQTQDAFGRILTTTDSRTGTTTMNGYRENGAVISVTTNAGSDTTSHAHDVMGRVTATTLPDNSVTRSSYTPRGQVKATWGSQTCPTFRTYDAAGRQQTLRTYQSLAANTEPTAAAGGSVTTWLYDSQRGWLTEKNHAGETDDGTTDADHTYTKSGRLKTRKWERGVLTTYGYDRGSLETVSYSGETNGHTTPSLAYTYDAFGRIATVKRGGADHASYTYDPAKLVLTAESLNQDTLARTLERNYDALLRPMSLEVPGEYTAGCDYDTSGRLWKVWDHPTLAAGTKVPSGTAFTYGYQARSHGLLHTVTGPAHTVTNSYEPTRDVLDTRTNTETVGASSDVSIYGYIVNSIGQRTQVARSGTEMSAANAIGWDYNGRGELTKEDFNANATDDARDRVFQYDAIGNREKATSGTLTPGTTNYVANPLNQYTTANGIALPAGDALATPPVLPAYDADGNFQHGPLPVAPSSNAVLVWDAENRLVKVTTATAVTTCAYDHLGRRISKSVDPTTGDTVTTHYLYDGWNLIAEYTANTLKKTCTWGMDLSGTMQGAGGVGGLLAVSEHSLNGETPVRTPFYPTFDGNGNVSEYLDGAGAKRAHYEYDAFGNLIASAKTGDKADDFAHRFSTKPLDLETGLYYYGFRYYDPLTGRWPSRDPIGERGGINLYGFVGNDGVNRWDLLGLENDGSVLSILNHALNTWENLTLINPFNNIFYGDQGSDYLMDVKYLGLDGSVIEGGADGGNLMEQNPSLKTAICGKKVGDEITVPSTLVGGWFSSNLAMTVGHINIKVSGSLKKEQIGTSKSCKWVFKGNANAEPDAFDFDQKLRPDVTSGRNWGIAVANALQQFASKWFYIKPIGSVKIETSGACP